MMTDACLSDIQRTKDSGRREGIKDGSKTWTSADRTGSTAAAELDAGREAGRQTDGDIKYYIDHIAVESQLAS